MAAEGFWHSRWRLLVRLYDRIDSADLNLAAAGIAFYGFLAIFPALAALIAIWGWASDPGVIRSQIELAQDFLPEQAYILFHDQVEALLAANSRHLGWASVLSTLIAIWSARAGVAALIRGLNATHRLPNRTGPWHIVRAMVLTMTLVGVGLVAMLLSVVAPLVLTFLPLGGFNQQVLELANVGVGILLVVFGVALAYRLGPNRPKGSPRPIVTWGLAVAVALWALASRGLVFYLTNFANYNEVYGSIGAVVALLVWLYLSAFAVLLGAAVDAVRAAPQ
ncbi:YihY/virulence factor BrkB family protein [Cereibacter sphaeroides]|uniref:YihY/virulence factor BrkB family protein n=1 Tax=Cereibacter sphaeroides TaxID=1063 RepID=UPI001F2DA977|nr:YihY/virulence factor BrkB family protein [Cereibacter sphaeroides]MCE6952240.1 YihY/virulence factor BrkB family protein [Cereibacter sphaeroides]